MGKHFVGDQSLIYSFRDIVQRREGGYVDDGKSSVTRQNNMQRNLNLFN